MSAPLTNPNVPSYKSSVSNITPSVGGSSHASDQSCLGGIRVIQVVKSATWEVLLSIAKVPSHATPQAARPIVGAFDIVFPPVVIHGSGGRRRGIVEGLHLQGTVVPNLGGIGGFGDVRAE